MIVDVFLAEPADRENVPFSQSCIIQKKGAQGLYPAPLDWVGGLLNQFAMSRIC